MAATEGLQGERTVFVEGINVLPEYFGRQVVKQLSDYALWVNAYVEKADSALQREAHVEIFYLFFAGAEAARRNQEEMKEDTISLECRNAGRRFFYKSRELSDYINKHITTSEREQIVRKYNGNL